MPPPGPAFARSVADAHERLALFHHDGSHVVEVHVDQAGVVDQVGNAPDRIGEDVVRHPEGLEHGHVLACHAEQPVVGNDDQGIHVLGELFFAGFGLFHLALSLKGEGLGDHAHGERAHVPGDPRHDGGCAGAGSAAHARGDEHHIGAFQGASDFLLALLGRALAHLRVSSCPEAPGELGSDLHPVGREGGFQCLDISVAGQEVHALEIGCDHVVDRVATASPDTDHLDLRSGIFYFFQLKHGLLLCLKDLFKPPDHAIQHPLEH